jgi:hypothetical protein
MWTEAKWGSSEAIYTLNADYQQRLKINMQSFHSML